ncbi:MAG: metal ABC transporter permease, partial [bacterium]|nr:metal ABC transporter permease [bacterium]
FPALSTPDWRVYAVTAGYCLIVAGLICLCSRRGLIAEDGAIGIFMSTGIAGGLFFFSLQGQHPVAFHNYLFGDVLATGSADLIVLGSITGLVLLALLVFSRWIQLTSFDPVYARAIGIPIHAVQGLILCLLALAVITSIKIAGVFFISALLVFPGAIARLFTLRWTTMLACSLWVGGLTTAAGFLLAMRWETIPPSAIIIALQFGVFLLAWVVSVWRQPA